MAKVAQQEIPDNDEQQRSLFDDARLRKARDFLATKISRGQKGFPYIEVVEITPELAAAMLERNPTDENRKLSEATVTKYADDMRAGRWQSLNGQTIVFSDDGYLNDGQHRMNALIQAQGRMPFHVVFGARRESRLTLDQNRVRTSGDYLAMTGIKNASNVATTAKMLLAYERGQMDLNPNRVGVFASGYAATKADLHAYATKHMNEIQRAYDALGYDWPKMPAPPSRLVAALILILRKCRDAEAVRNFVVACISGENVSKSHPAYQARERMIAEKIAGRNPAWRTVEIVLRCWNAYRAGQRMTRLSLRNELPKIEK